MAKWWINFYSHVDGKTVEWKFHRKVREFHFKVLPMEWWETFADAHCVAVLCWCSVSDLGDNIEKKIQPPASNSLNKSNKLTTLYFAQNIFSMYFLHSLQTLGKFSSIIICPFTLHLSRSATQFAISSLIFFLNLLTQLYSFISKVNTSKINGKPFQSLISFH